MANDLTQPNVVQPDIAPLSQPGSAAAGPLPGSGFTPPEPPAEAMLPPMAPPSMNTAPETGVNPRVPPPAPSGAGGHQKLLDMVQGLAVGLSASGKALATHGREGGAADVLAFQGEQQRQKIAQQTAASAQQEASLRFKLMTAETNMANGQVQLLHAKMPDEIAQSHLAVAGTKMETAAKAQEIFETQGYVPEGWTVDKNTGRVVQTGQAPSAGTAAPATSGAAPAGGAAPAKTPDVLPGVSSNAAPAAAAPETPEQSSPYIARLTMQANAIGEKLKDPQGNEDPDVATAKQIIANPATQPDQKQRALIFVQRKAAMQADILKTQQEKAAVLEKQHAADPLYKMENDPAEMTGDKAPAAMATLSAKLDDPNLPADQRPRVQRLLTMATKAKDNALAFDKAKETEKQAITDGDPKAAGALLYAGLAAPQELTSARKPAFAQAALDEAVRLGGGTKDPVTGKWTGGTWSAMKAESQYEYAKNPKTQNTLNLLATMQQPGGSIDIAQKMFNTIPGKIDEQTFNKIMTGAITEFGGKSTVEFKAALTSLADEYAQVLQGGAATETTLQQAKDLIKESYSKAQGAGAFDTIRLDMAARQKGMVRDNPALMSMYPEPKTSGGPKYPRPANVPGSWKLMQVPNTPAHWIDPAGPNWKAAQNAGAVDITEK